MKNQQTKFTMASRTQILRSPRWLVMMFLLPLLAMVHFALAAPAPVDPLLDPSAASAVAVDKFDHAKTGFPLTGSHTSARCISCHINNVFKGIPRDCATCHRLGNQMAATAKPSNHINTNAQCDTCHKTTVWTPATFSHISMPSGDCATCHNGATAQGKPTLHVPVPATISCDNCHKTTTWLQVAFSHKGIYGGCTDCHTGQPLQGMATPKGKPNNHMLTGLDCVSCHSTIDFVILKPGAPVSINPATHIPTTQPCSVCHNGGSFAPARMSHAGIMGNCEQCHDNGSGGSRTFSEGAGVTPRSKADAVPSHIPTSLPCASCHTVSTTFKLSPGAVIPMPVGHLPSTQPCATCHNMQTGFLPAKMSHAGISTKCADCHTAGKTYSGSPNMRIVPKSANHVPTNLACETCHNASNTSGFNSFLGIGSAIMQHTGIVNGCAACHVSPYPYSGTPIVAKSATSPVHVPTNRVTLGANCETCHSATMFSSFAGALMKHSGILNGCKDCHNGSTTFQGMGLATYWPAAMSSIHATQTDCVGSGCHTTTTFSSASGSKSTTHIPTTATCSSCHPGGASQVATMNHAGMVSGCAACHNGQSFADHTSSTGLKPVSKANFPPHVATALDCSSCHYPSPNGFTSFAGATGGALPLNHLPTSQPCSTCHTSFGANSGHMSHVGIVGGCATCHNGQTFAVGMKPVSKPTGALPHIPTSLACEACHSPSNFNSFSGTAMKHTGITTGCASCHDAGKVFAGGIVTLPGNHVPTSSTGAMGAPGSQCEACHSKTNFTTFSGIPMNHIGVTGKPCKDCHTGQAFAGGTPRHVGSITNHIPYAANLLGGSTMDCNHCHKSTAVGGFSILSVPSATMHNGSRGRGTGGDGSYCAGCHLSGTNYLGVQGRKSLTHERPAPQPDCSNSGCHKPLGNEGTAYTSW